VAKESRASFLTLEALEALKTKLTALPHKQVYSKKEAIGFLQEEIRGLLEKNYSMPEIAKFLQEEGGLDIAPATLGRFMSERNKTGRKKTIAARRNSATEKAQETGEASEGIAEAEKATEDAPQSQKKRGIQVEKPSVLPQPPEEKSVSPERQKDSEDAQSAKDGAPEKTDISHQDPIETPQPDTGKERGNATEQKPDQAGGETTKTDKGKDKPKSSGFSIREDTEDL